jgi:hypothetical protein
MVRMLINGDKLPEITMDQLNEMANAHAREHAGCTREEVVAILHQNGARLIDFVAGLTDEQPGRTGYLATTGGHVSARELIKVVIFQSAGEHLANMKKTLTA